MDHKGIIGNTLTTVHTDLMGIIVLTVHNLSAFKRLVLDHINATGNTLTLVHRAISFTICVLDHKGRLDIIRLLVRTDIVGNKYGVARRGVMGNTKIPASINKLTEGYRVSPLSVVHSMNLGITNIIDHRIVSGITDMADHTIEVEIMTFADHTMELGVISAMDHKIDLGAIKVVDHTMEMGISCCVRSHGRLGCHKGGGSHNGCGYQSFDRSHRTLGCHKGGGSLTEITHISDHRTDLGITRTVDHIDCLGITSVTARKTHRHSTGIHFL